MEVRLPMVVCHRGRRSVEAWIPGIPSAYKLGPSLAEIRDDLALAVMERFEQGPADMLGQFQLPPHVRLELVEVEAVALDKKRNRRIPLKARIGVLLEKWPDDDFYVATPTRIPAARFALASPDLLDEALGRRLAAYVLEHDLETLEPFHAEFRERLDILDVDADAPSIFPRGARLRPKPRTKKRKDAVVEETPRERDERRRARRLQVKTLRAIARNLTHAAMDDTLPRAFGREALVRDVLDAIDGSEGTSIVLVGPSGVGKTAIVNEVVRRLYARSTGANVRRDVWRIDGHRFIAGMSFVGQWEARARELIEELRDLGDVLHVDDLLSIVFAGRHRKGSTSLAQFLEPHMARGELSILAESTAERFERVREESPTFAAQFRMVHVPALDDRATLPVLLGVMRDLEGSDGAAGVVVTPEALESVLQLSRRFMAHDAFPGKAVRLLRAAVGDAPGPRTVGAPAVTATVQRNTGLPPFVLGLERPRPRATIRANLTAMVAGQPEAIDAVTDMIVALQHALADPDKPLATFLFVGPTGVGKTETAKAMARFLFGGESRLVRFDMSEFQSTASVSRLIGHPGAPDGELTLALRTQPFCVVLFDEVEKAHPRVFDALLQLLGEGRLTDAAGRTADARQAVIVMTSNLGVREAVDRTGFVRDATDESRKHYLGAVRAFFRPEFFNRIDRVVPFDALGPDALRVVVEHALADLLARRGIQRGNVMVDVEPELLDLLVEQAYDPRYGARPLRRALERRLAVPLAHHLVRRESDDLALVHLFRRGSDMALGVRALRDDRLIAGIDDPTAWTTSQVFAAFAALAVELDAVRDSPAYERLEDIRQRALRNVTRNADDEATAVIELLERIEGFALRVRDLDDGDFSDSHYDMHEVRDGGGGSDPLLNPRKHGIRPRTGVMEIPVSANRDAIAHRTRTTVAALRDEITLLAHQVRAAAERGIDRYTVVIEQVTPRAMQHVSQVAFAVTFPFARTARRAGILEGGRPAWTTENPTFDRQTRIAVAMEGFGLREVLDAWIGYHLGAVSGPSGPTNVLVETSLVEGTDPALLDAHDRRRAEENLRRRSGDETDPVIRRRVITRAVANGPQRHLATGLGILAHDAIAAALLRTLREG